MVKLEGSRTERSKYLIYILISKMQENKREIKSNVTEDICEKGQKIIELFSITQTYIKKFCYKKGSVFES